MHTFWFDKRFYAAILMGMAVCVVADAQGISATSALRLGDSPERDFQLTVHARKALSDKTELAHLNLGIRVRQGVVTIWGPVPDKPTAQQVFACLYNLKGVSGVQSELYVGSGGEGVQAFAVPSRRGPIEMASAPPALVNEPAKGGSGVKPSELTGTSRVLRMGSDSTNKPIQPAPSKLTAIAERPKFNPASQPAQVLDPEMGIRNLLRSQPKFGLMLYRLESGTLLIQGGGDANRQMEFAQACSTIPGIYRVKIGQQ